MKKDLIQLYGKTSTKVIKKTPFYIRNWTFNSHVILCFITHFALEKTLLTNISKQKTANYFQEYGRCCLFSYHGRILFVIFSQENYCSAIIRNSEGMPLKINACQNRGRYIGCLKNTKSLKSQAPQGFSGCLDIGNNEMSAIPRVK